MLSTIRKFSGSIVAKVFLFIVAIPFIFWGMGPVFQSGKLNTIAEIGDNKIPTQDFINFLKFKNINSDILDERLIQHELSNFIGEKLISLEIENNNILLSDKSLSRLIKNEKIFKEDNKFSRTKYEKYLIENSLVANMFESNISSNIKKKQLFSFIGGGVLPPEFIVSNSYNQINQSRDIQIINLNNIFGNKLIFTEDDLKKKFDNNKDKFKEVYKTFKFLKLNTNNLTGDENFTDMYFEKLDEIDNLIAEGRGIDFILKKFSLENAKTIKINKDEVKNNMVENDLPKELIKKIYNMNENESTTLMEHKDNYFIIELESVDENIKKYSDSSVKKEIIEILKNDSKRILISELISKINKNEFNKNDFEKFSKDKNIEIKKVKIKNLNDNNVLEENLIIEIYSYPEKSVVVVNDLNFSKNYLVYIDKVTNKEIGKDSVDYDKYLNLAKVSMLNDLYNTYDSYLKKKYKININFKALDNVYNLFR
tara:strand:+ start:1427 stop:2872 length:1446 start_codon:yes stop_codon:yes gene_type:complete